MYTMEHRTPWHRQKFVTIEKYANVRLKYEMNAEYSISRKLIFNKTRKADTRI